MKLQFVLCLTVLLGGCKGEKDSARGGDNTLAPGTPGVAGVAPGRSGPDQLGSDELLEGKDHAFGLPLPEGVVIFHQTYTHVRARGALQPEKLANFVRKRVDAEVETGPNHTQFSRARVKDPVGGNHMALKIDISLVNGLTVADISIDGRGPVPASPNSNANPR